MGLALRTACQRRPSRLVVPTGAVCAALLVTACSSAATPATPAAHQARATLARQYLTIARAGNHHLESDFDGLRASRIRLVTAAADLRDAAATERLFDRRLLTMPLPPAIDAIAHVLVSANEARARLSVHAARSTSLAQLRGYEARLTAANAPVEDGVRVIRGMLGLPPPQSG